jgi:membrane-bound lytic murein transglycosylase F
MRPRLVVVAVLALVAVAPRAALAGARGEHAYDDHFRKYSKRFFGVAFDWRLFKAQAIIESNLQPEATSRRGAQGVMQIMPATYGEITAKNPGFGDIRHPEWNIAAGIWYAKWLWDSWRGEVMPGHHRHFMLGSYNAGRLTLARAQRIAAERELDRRLWSSIESVAPNVPRWSYRETLAYVVKIFTLLGSMDHRGRIKA